VLVLAGVLVVAGLRVSRYVDSSERAALDDRLRRTAELSEATALDAVEGGLPDPDRRLDAALDATRTSVRLVVGDTVLLETGTLPPAEPAARPGLQTLEAGGERYRAYVTTLADPDLAGIARLEVVTALAALERSQADLDRRLLALGAAALAIAAVGTWLAAEVVLRPVRRLRRVASRVARDEDLGRRVPEDDGPGELRSLAASFNAMLERLGRSTADRERALEATRRFAADAGHELRTPLTAVQATLDALRRHPGIPEERRAAMLADAAAEQRRLVDLLDGLQALARGDAPSAVHTEIDLADVTDAACVAVAARHPATEITAALPDAPVVVRGWEPGLRLIVDNLVENAAQHGRPDGHVAISLDDDGVLRVDDDGPGVPVEERERIFEPFARLDGGGPGSGLGLALVAQQARHHGAQVTVAESPLGGARFTVRF